MGCTFEDVLQRNDVGMLDSEGDKWREIIEWNIFLISHISLMLTVNWSPDGILAAQLKSPSHLFPLRRRKHYSKLESNLCVCPVLLTDKLGKPLGVKRREAFDALTVSCCG